MTTPQDDGGSAFPVVGGTKHDGMSLRDWFAGMALQGVIAKHPTRYSPTGDPIDMEIALGAYDYADAMLAARKEQS